MKKYILVSGSILIIFSILAFEILSSGGKAGYTNSPGENNCTSCHSGTINSGPGSIEIKSDPSLQNGYEPGTIYTITVSVKNSVSPNNEKFGFAVEALFVDGSNGGKLVVTNANLTQIQTASINGNNRDNVIHTGSNNTGPNSQDFSFDWTAPNPGDKTVTFYAVGNAANNNGSTSGDNIYSTSLEVKPNTTGIVTNELVDDVKVFPNPSNGIFVVELNDLNYNSYNLTIANTEGSIIYQAQINNKVNQIDLSKFPKGNYFMKLSNQNKNTTKKISIQ